MACKQLSRIAVIMCLGLMSAAPMKAQYGAGIVHFAYTGSNGHIFHVTPNQLWQDLTYMLGAPLTQISTGEPTTGFSDGVGDHIFYVGATEGHVYQLYYCGKNCVPLDTWTLQDTTAMANNAPLPVSGGPLSSFVSGTQEHVLYFGTNYHVYQLVTTSSGSWTYQDLTVAAGCVAAASNSPIGSFNDSLGQHVFYFGGSYHVRQLYYAYSSDTWVCQDLTASTGAPVAASGSALTSFVDSEEHVVYQDGNRNIYQLITHPGAWGYQQLPTPGGSTAAQGTPLTSTVDLTHSYEFVFYCVPTGGVYALIFSGSVWTAYSVGGVGAQSGVAPTSTWASQVGVLILTSSSEYNLQNFSISANGSATFNDDFGAAPAGILPGASLLMFVDE